MGTINVSFAVGEAMAALMSFLSQEGGFDANVDYHADKQDINVDLDANFANDNTDKYIELFESIASKLDHSLADVSFKEQVIIQLKELCIAFGIASLIEQYLNDKKKDPSKLLHLKQHLKEIFVTVSKNKQYQSAFQAILGETMPDKVMDQVNSIAFGHKPNSPSLSNH